MFSNFSAERVEFVAQIVGAVFVVATGYLWRRATIPAESEV